MAIVVSLILAVWSISLAIQCQSRFFVEQCVEVTTPFAGDVDTLAVNPGIPSMLYAGTFTMGTFRSEDRGVKWWSLDVSQSKVHISTIAIDPVNPSTIYLGSSEAGIFKSIDSGWNWSQANDGLTTPDVRAVLVDPRNHDTVYAGTWGGEVHKSTDLRLPGRPGLVLTGNSSMRWSG
jgi:hypothetical protein